MNFPLTNHAGFVCGPSILVEKEWRHTPTFDVLERRTIGKRLSKCVSDKTFKYEIVFFSLKFIKKYAQKSNISAKILTSNIWKGSKFEFPLKHKYLKEIRDLPVINTILETSFMIFLSNNNDISLPFNLFVIGRFETQPF